ncbi:cyclin-domain-containing protein [Cokeromyces recurvatus]|uniref:cyclin-domain-containing protein n=1 Tax=Cokeromyces recurvatus TaxID=90255 RepID=UPI00221FBFBB|nr:cyclin-domain-containing protein [Cokeromyces recurvatus]KAI7906897.1 cyclin-domain-containing protein [Cokeromyces recurvatus]
MNYHLNIAQYPTLILAKIVADLLNSVIEANDKLINNTTILTRFHSRAATNMDIYSYILRILKYTPFTNEVLIYLLIYFDRISNDKNYILSSSTVHRLLITSIIIATKFTSDIFYPNIRYAKVGGIRLDELNQLELDFLFLCDFNLYIKLEEVQAYGNQLLAHAIKKQQRNRSMISPSTTTIDASHTTLSSSSSRKRMRGGNKNDDHDHDSMPIKIMKKRSELALISISSMTASTIENIKTTESTASVLYIV